MNKTTRIALTGIGIALYVVLSMVAKIPVIAHIRLDLGYIAFAVYCYHLGTISGMIVGGAGCVLISLLTTGWFPPGWLAGNLLIGLICGLAYRRNGDACSMLANVAITIAAVVVGIVGVKTVIECVLYGIPYAVKLPKNLIAAAMDAAVMVAGVIFAQRGPIVKWWARYNGRW